MNGTSTLKRRGAEDMLKEDGEDPICSEPAKTDRVDVHIRLIADIAVGMGLQLI